MLHWKSVVCMVSIVGILLFASGILIGGTMMKNQERTNQDIDYFLQHVNR